MDRRQARTREAIFDGFCELLSRKAFSQITVQDIIDRANVGRTTFYAHFKTKDELLKALCEDMFTHVFAARPPREAAHDFSGEPGGAKETITHILYHLLENRRNIIGILNFGNGELMYGFFRKFFETYASARILAKEGRLRREVPQDFIMSHIASAFIGAVQWWIKNGMTEPPEAIAHYFMAVVEPLWE
ncbi:MAG: TetR/AcrR family transcriptional regulator [Desulfovibrio sp.]|nr:TetR/AcrR family transcriptional regulator [Desulfovibrio sp.]